MQTNKQTVDGQTLSYQLLLTLIDRMRLLKPSSTMLRISVSVVISLPSRHSRPYREMEGTENIWAEGKRWRFRGRPGRIQRWC